MEDQLQLAKKYEKQRNWKKAISYFEQYISENEKTSPDKTFVSYAKCLRMIGRTEAAKEVLAKGKQLHPDSEHIWRELYNLYDYVGDWEIAKNVAKKLLKLHPSNPNYHFLLGRSYSFLQQFNPAKKEYKRALSLVHTMPFNNIIKKIEAGITEDTSKITSHYIFIEGKNNLGAIIHQYENKRFFTKISKYTKANVGAAREETFYEKVCEDFPDLNNVAPKFIHSQRMDGISYLTVEMIDAKKTGTIEHSKKIIEAIQQLSTVRYNQLMGKYPPPNYVFQFKKGRGISVVHYFTKIHDENINKKLFESMNLIIKQNNYPLIVQSIMKRAESVIMDGKLYQYMIPEKHYSLLHGDFAFQNVLIDKNTMNPRIIDWTTFTIGPHFIDIARYVTSELLPYSKVKDMYLNNKDTGGKLTKIEQIFFLYSLLIFYFQKLGRKAIETELTTYLLPVVEELEQLVFQFQKSLEGDHLSNDKQNLQDLKIKQLEERVKVLEVERNAIHQRLDDMLNSKSWKITEPLRLFTERKKKKNI